MVSSTINDAQTIAGNGEGTPSPENGTPMDRSIGDGPTMRPKEERGVHGAFAPGDVIAGRYVVEKVLGEGGMGIVYQCLDRVGGVSVAVKCLPPEVSRNADEMDDIRANYRLVADLHHPNIAGARTLEVDGSTGDYYLVMDLARGTSLKRWARRHPDADRDAKLAILRQVAAALDYAHARKVIHRDVKPENVMVDDEGGVKVLDFGLAAQIRSSQSRTSNAVTSKGGTPGYKSPEQWLGRPQQAPADVYAFGVMAYWLFAGHLPFDGDDPTVLGHAVLSAPVEPIPDLPAHMNAALAKALAKAPEDRFSSCTAFVDALEGKVGSRVPRDRMGGPRSRATAKILLAAALLAALAGGAWWFVNARAARSTGTTGVPPVAEVRLQGTSNVAKPLPPQATSGTALADVEVAKRKAEEAAKQRTDDAHQKAEEAKARMAEFMQLKTRINIKVSDAKEKMGRISEFRANPDGLETHIASADAQWKAIVSIGTPDNVEDARTLFNTADKAEGQIALDLDWLRKNKAGRDAAKAAADEIKNLLAGDATTFNAERYATKSYCEGTDLRTQGQAAFKKGEFAEAGKLLSEAKAKFAEAAREAKEFFVKTTLQSAQTYFEAEKWQDCVAEADKVLSCEEDNEVAAKLKQDAKSHLVPFLRVVAQIDGRAIEGAKMTVDGTEQTLPLEWKNLKGGECRGPYMVSYESGGKRYDGVFDLVTVDWCGLKEITVALKYRAPREGDCMAFKLPGGVSMEMVYVAPGSFLMGSPPSEEDRYDDELQHRVTLTKGYWIGKYPVTQSQWNALVSSIGVLFEYGCGCPMAYFSRDGKGVPHELFGIISITSTNNGVVVVNGRVLAKGTESSGARDTSEFPMENISWNDCKALVDAINEAESEGRCWSLPTEAQWEFAARGGNRSRGYKYSGGDNLDVIGWSAENSSMRQDSGMDGFIYGRSHSVKEKNMENELGIVGMSGNVLEWCNDWYGKDYYANSPSEDPQGPATGKLRVLRGGCWAYGSISSRSANRSCRLPGVRFGNYGLRLICFAEPGGTPRRKVREQVRRVKWYKEGEQFVVDPSVVNLTMKWCPPGSFMMGSPATEEGRYDVESQHLVTLTKGFWMGETEVTQGQWKKIMNGETIIDLARKGLQVDCNGDPNKRCGVLNDNIPVYNVNWYEAVEFCRKLTERARAEGRIPDGYEYRLPTEAEWEYACRAGTTEALPNGWEIRILGKNNAPTLDDIAWYGGNSSRGFDGQGVDTSGWPEKQYPGGRALVREVKGKQPNKWGLYDMIGNVCEWCGDSSGDYSELSTERSAASTHPPEGNNGSANSKGFDFEAIFSSNGLVDPIGAVAGTSRVTRGGSWSAYARYCRSAYRDGNSPDFRANYLGFRVALAPSR